MEEEAGPERGGDLLKVTQPEGGAMRIQALAGPAPEPKSFHGSSCFRRRLGQRACGEVCPLYPAGCDDSISGEGAEVSSQPSHSVPSTSQPPVLLLQPLIHLQLHPEGLQELVVLRQQLLPQFRLLLHPAKAPRPQGDVNSDAKGLTDSTGRAPPLAAPRVWTSLTRVGKNSTHGHPSPSAALGPALYVRYLPCVVFTATRRLRAICPAAHGREVAKLTRLWLSQGCRAREGPAPSDGKTMILLRQRTTPGRPRGTSVTLEERGTPKR